MDIKIRPSHRQFWVDNLSILFVGLILLGGLCCFSNPTIVLSLSATLFSLILYSFYRWVYLRSHEWIIKQEEIIQRVGWLSSTTDHIEMYRIIDYQETQSLLQRFFSVKTIVFISTDRLNNILYIKGVQSNSSLLQTVRGRVELCKTNKRIYEIANH